MADSVASLAADLQSIVDRLRALKPDPEPGAVLSIVSGSRTFGETDQDRPIRLTVVREGDDATDVAATWTVIEGADQLAAGQRLTGRIEVPADQTSAPLSLMLKGDKTPEPDARLVVTLSEPEGADLAVATVEVVIVDDDTAQPPPGRHPLFPGWKLIKPRSGRIVAGGPTYWGRNWRRYEQEVAYVDGFGGGNFGDKRERTRTPELLSGGPRQRPHQIDPQGQMAWMTTEGNFASPFREHVPNSAYLCHVFETCPGELLSFPKAPGWYERVANSDENNWVFWNMAIRIMDQLQARQIDPALYIGRPDHEMQQDFLRPGWKDTYRRAMDKIIKQMRRAAGFDLHIAFAPAKEKIINLGAGPEDFGPLDSWMPAECDMISMSFHPDRTCVDRASYLRFANGGGNLYGLYTDVLELSKKRKVPIGILEWSPRVEVCPIADQVYGWLMDDFLKPNADRIILELVHHPDTITPSAADNQARQTPAGKAAWRRSVGEFKRVFGGKKP